MFSSNNLKDISFIIVCNVLPSTSKSSYACKNVLSFSGTTCLAAFYSTKNEKCIPAENSRENIVHLRSRHWLPVSEKIDFEILLLVYKAVNSRGLKKCMQDLLVSCEALRSSGTWLLCVHGTESEHIEAAFLELCASNFLPT